MYNRKRFWIQPGFQKRVILFWVVQALVVAVCAYFVTIFLAGRSATPEQAALLRELVRPALLVSAAIGFAVSCLAGLVFSHRIAGPVHRIKKSIDKIINGKFAEPIMLRQDDELKDLAASINMLLQYFWLKGGPKGEAE